ncbi:FeoA family protein [Aporhodopirellula aestuarii]|uniref:Ferrous iron transport protein A n=1 Tax=Aporhodopirellula aestuarii TaxID=2950107 RepID=A0ABT0UAQ9_9BACT|nr:ferrous iron transport protein A [Aporhodopirellula aestuarii]MCM2374098.1 ferrous iron transport protein A [Aporhodopirellula aestuarii]
MFSEITLDHFIGTAGEIARLDLPEACAIRLKSLGLFEGQYVQLARSGNPMIVKAAGGKIAVAGDIAKGIYMRVAHS